MFAFVSLCSCAGLFSSSGDFEMSECTFRNNVITSGELLVMTGGTSLISLCTFTGNNAKEGMGILHINSATVTLSNLQFVENFGRDIFIKNCVVSKEMIVTDKCSEDDAIIINDNSDLSGVIFECHGEKEMTAAPPVSPYIIRKRVRRFGTLSLQFAFCV